MLVEGNVLDQDLALEFSLVIGESYCFDMQGCCAGINVAWLEGFGSDRGPVGESQLNMAC